MVTRPVIVLQEDSEDLEEEKDAGTMQSFKFKACMTPPFGPLVFPVSHNAGGQQSLDFPIPI